MKTLLILIIYLIAFDANSQNSFRLIPKWKIGEKLQFEVSKINLKVKNDSITKNDTSSYVGYWEILDKKEDYTLQWSMSNDYLNTPKSPEKSTTNELNINIIYTTDSNGTFLKIKNLREVKKTILAIFDEMKTGPFDTKEEEKAAKASVKFLRSLYKDKYVLETMIGKEIKALHHFFGMNLPLAQDTIITAGETFNLFSEDNIPTETLLYLEEMNTEKDLCSLLEITKYDAEFAKQLAINLSQKYGDKPVNEINTSDLSLDIQKINKATFSLTTFTPLIVETESKTITNSTIEKGYSSKRRIIKRIKMN